MIHFARRNALEILRDPMAIVFGVLFPVVLLVLLSVIQRNIPVSLFEINSLLPGICVFSLSFLTLFTALLIAKDRQGMLLMRLLTTPLTGTDFVIGYMLPVVPIGIAQTLVCVLAAVPLGLSLHANVLLMIVFMLPTALFYISLGVLFGSFLTEKQVGGICGALLTNVSAWLSGIWFDLALVGGAFRKIAYALPFVHAVEMERSVLSGDLGQAGLHLLPVLGYTLVFAFLSVTVFLRKMRK